MSLKKANEKAVQADEWEGGGGGVCVFCILFNWYLL